MENCTFNWNLVDTVFVCSGNLRKYDASGQNWLNLVKRNVKNQISFLTLTLEDFVPVNLHLKYFHSGMRIMSEAGSRKLVKPMVIGLTIFSVMRSSNVISTGFVPKVADCEVT